MFAVAMDVTNSASVRRAAEAAVARFGKMDVVVNNAGYGLMGAIEELDAPELEDVFKTNFFGVQRVLRVFLRILRAQRAGWIVNISSKARRQHYNASRPHTSLGSVPSSVFAQRAAGNGGP